ncbi:ABC transporter permease [Confluentibacter sediminis]|uniref:ABC transporter permease n=1 Tax=Confluentibacter sediminis TaxID=2219045 RepID=UPI001C737A79|nr:ABC transporter permease [Confluentibacter sediminis]
MNYFKIAWRNLKQNKFYSIIHISGLAIGLAAAIMVLAWVQSEKSFDTFHKDYKDIYVFNAQFNINGENRVWGGVPGPLAVYSKSISEVGKLVRINSESNQTISDIDRDKILGGLTVAAVDNGFFSLFDFNVIEGQRNHLFPDVNSVVITKSMANKFFGDHNVLGKTLKYRNENFTVTGVLEDFPENSSLQYDAIFPMALYSKEFKAGGGNGDWKTIDEDLGNYSFQTFVKLHANADANKVANKFTKRYMDVRNNDPASKVEFKLQNLADMHLITPDGNKSAYRMVQVFLLVAILLLAIASINYINLSTARSLTRAKEVGVRKVVGANKKQLFFQFIIETIVLFSIALIIALVLVFLLKPFYNSVSGRHLETSFGNTSIWSTIGFALLGMLMAVSIYPAMVLSAFKPLPSLKGKIASGVGIVALRKALVVFQFAVSVILIVGTLVISSQMKHIRKMDLGYDKDYVFSVSFPIEAAKNANAIKSELEKEPSIQMVSATGIGDMSQLDSETSDLEWSGQIQGQNLLIAQASIDNNFIPTMKMQLVEGANFSGLPSDKTSYIVNETAVKEMGLNEPIVGQKIKFHNNEGTIIGVVKDFNFKSLRDPISPLLFNSNWGTQWGWGQNIFYVRTTAGEAQKTIAAVKKQYDKIATDIPFSYQFVDKQFEAKYEADTKTGNLFNFFAALTIFISCLGLLGLTTYTARVRIKEIGVRKVLGASVNNLVKLLVKDFIFLVILAILIASPIAWWLMDSWLSSYAYRIQVSWQILLLAGCSAVVIALLTVSFQAIKAAIANPIKSLRTE